MNITKEQLKKYIAIQERSRKIILSDEKAKKEIIEIFTFIKACFGDEHKEKTIIKNITFL
jgi:predicted transport protein